MIITKTQLCICFVLLFIIVRITPMNNTRIRKLQALLMAGIMVSAVLLACSLAAAQNPASVLGSYVRIEHRGEKPGAIELAEVQVINNGTNIASMGEASQSGTWENFGAELAIDGVEKGDVYYNHSTALTAQPPIVGDFWELAFPKPARIDKLVIYTRPEANCAFRNDSVWIQVLNADRQVIWEQQMPNAPTDKDFRADFAVTVLNVANNPDLAATEILSVPTTVPNKSNVPWDVKPAGSDGVPSLGFKGGRTEAGASGEFAVFFGSEATPFRLTGSALGKASTVAELKDGILRWHSGENANWKSAEAVLSPLEDGVQMDVTVDWKADSFGTPLVDLALGNPMNPGSGWLRDAKYEGERYKDGLAFGFLAPVTKRKPLIGGHPLRSVKFDSPELGNRRLLISQPASPGRATLATEADNVTHLYLEPRLVKAGQKHCYSLKLHFPERTTDTTATKVAALPKSRSLLQGKFTLNALGSGVVIPEFEGKKLLRPVQGVYTRDGIPVSFDDASWQSATLTREYWPANDPKAIGQVVFRAQNADIRVEQKATLGKQDSSGQFLRCPYQIETTVEALRPGIRDFRLVAEPESDRYQSQCKAMTIDDWVEKETPRVATPGRELTVEYKPDPDMSFGGASVHVTALAGNSAAQTSERKSSLVLSPTDLKPGNELNPGTRHTVKLKAMVTLFNDYGGPIRIAHPGRRSPYFTLPEAAVVQVKIPTGAGALSVTAKDGGSGAALPEQAVLKALAKAKGDFGMEDVYVCRLDRKRPGVTALKFKLTSANGQVETRTFEVAHIGQVTAKPKVVADLPDEKLLDLEKIDSIDCASDNDPHPRLDFPGASEVVDTPIGKARLIGERGAVMIWEIQLPPESINQPHLLVAEYPDDARRNMSLNVFETADQIDAGGASWNSKGRRDGMGTGVQTGWPFPLSRQARKMNLLWWPAHKTVYVAVACCINPEWFHASVGNACVKRISVYRVKGELPAVQPAFEAPGRFIGAHAEDNDLVANDFRGLTEPDEGPPGNISVPERWLPRYLAKYYNSWEHYLQYLRFAGQNIDASSVHRYAVTGYPGAPNTMGQPNNYSPGIDNQELLARMAGSNGAGVIMNIEATQDLNQRMTQIIDEEEERIAANPAALEPTVAMMRNNGTRTTNLRWLQSLNFNAPETRRELLGVVEDMARRYEGVPGVLGIGCLAGEWLYPTYQSGWFGAGNLEQHFDTSYDDRTMAMFEKEAGVKIPVPIGDPERYNKRYQWIMANARQAWIDWRCRRLFALADDMRRISAAYGRPLWFTGFAQHDLPWMERLALEKGGLRDMLKVIGYDPALFSNAGDLRGGWTYTELMDTRNPPRGRNWIGDGLRKAFLEDPASRQALPQGPNTTAYLFNAFRENPFPVRPWMTPFTWRKLRIGEGMLPQLKGSASYVYPAPGFGARDFVMLMAAGSPPATIMHTWMDCGFGQIPSQDSRRFSLAFRTLPLCDYTTLTGKGLDRNLVVRQGVFEGKTYFFVINPTWSAIKAELRCDGKGAILELVRGTKFEVGGRKILALDLKPYDLKTFRIKGGVTVTGATTEPAAAGLAECARRLDEAEALLNAWGAALPEGDPERLAVAKEVAAGRARITECDLRGAILVSDGWRLRTALQKLLPPPGYAVAAAPAADAVTELLLHLDEETGAVADASGKNLKVEGAAAPAVGRFGKARDMRNSGFKAELPGVLTGGGSWTFECWVTPTSDWAANTAVPVATIGKYFTVRWGPASLGGMRELPLLNVDIEDGKGMEMRLGVHAPCKPGVWYHVAVVYDKDAKRDHVKVYVNGRLEDFETCPDGNPLTPVKDAPAVLEFGQGPALLDEVRVSNKARTLQEMGYPTNSDHRSWSDRLRE
jgi:hypothetical protein